MALLSESIIHSGRVSRGRPVESAAKKQEIATDKIGRGVLIGIIDEMIPRVAAAPPVPPNPSLDDYDYILRLEAENARRHVIFVSGNAQLSGGGELVLDGDPASFISTTSILRATIGTNKFVMRMKVTLNVLTEQFLMGPGGRGSDTTSWANGWGIRYSPTRGLCFFKPAGADGPASDESYCAWSPSIGVEYDLHVVRTDADQLRMYINGNYVTVTNPTRSESIASTPNKATRIGQSANGGTSFPLNGNVSLVQIDVGTDLGYTGSTITPPSGLDLTTNPALALDFAGPAAGVRILDSATPANLGIFGFLPDISGNENDAISVGEPTYRTIEPKIVLNGSGQYLTGTLAQAQIFTVYMVADISADTVAQTFFGDVNAYLQLNSSEHFLANAGSTLTDANNRSGAKHVFSAEFSNTTGKLYLDGTMVASGTIGAGALAAFGIGARSDGASPTIMDFYACFLQDLVYSEALNNLIMDKYGV